MSGILLKNAPVGNIFAIHVTFIDKTDESFYFYANGFVGAQDSL
ncbi:phosphoribosylformyl-glycineamide synthetase [Klebsiella aerogenes]|nr:phosphoribosylformyl-glycineamide synthetase [Klebsiella aerogenes]ATX90112.1 phosphoribosylformyl-glycineamide synthetase [Klebsiella aerogenes]ATY01462.1 phosphoribosylformyl-glycineamide synthetase [Klebsiella aerogenes]ATY08878.1 phosphoribosylformyl-glycineamide synthetase [Klebsiella aerogenes]AUY89184.1 phosphoribosylformyl-glycineamide synthetase [Klebsiella aerogenes]